ncbi:MAG TPA: iron ABC transporter permease [Phycisphaerae bacterium]|nr:iron ABC transporter permease [Phycisphaerae bacterium]HPS53179.1 iron ABC transporter permease [Phycisphaerae bacterium]
MSFGGYIKRIFVEPFGTSLTAGLTALLAAALIYPVCIAVHDAFVTQNGQFSLYWFTRLADDGSLRLLGNSLLLAAITTVACTIISLPLALLRVECEFIGREFFSLMMLAPLILPPFVGAIAIQRFLGQFGSLNLLLDRLGVIDFASGELPPDWLASGFVGVVIMQVLHLFPIIYLNAAASLTNLDPSQVEAAENLGAPAWVRLRRIILPQIRPGLFAGGAIVFIWSLTDIGTPLMLNYRDLAGVRIFSSLTSGKYFGSDFALVVVLLAVSIACYVLGKFVLGREPEQINTRAMRGAVTKRLGAAGTLGAWVLFGTVTVMAILPHIGVVLSALAGDWFDSILPEQYTFAHMAGVVTDSQTYLSIVNSLQYAGCSTVIDIIMGGLIAWLLVRGRTVGSSVLDAMAMLPLAVPGLILAAGYVAMTATGPLAKIGPLGKYPAVILIIAYSVRRLPLVVRGISAGLQQIPTTYEEAARNLGAGRIKTARRITLPLLTSSFAAAAVLAFAFAMLEVSDSLVLAQVAENYPITKQIYSLYNSGTGFSANIAAALGVYGMVLLGGTMAISSIIMGRKFGSIFRA